MSYYTFGKINIINNLWTCLLANYLYKNTITKVFNSFELCVLVPRWRVVYQPYFKGEHKYMFWRNTMLICVNWTSDRGDVRSLWLTGI